MCRKQMLPHDFWVFVLMMSSTRLSFTAFNGGSAWFKVRFYGWSSGFQSSSSPRAMLELFYTAWLYFFTPQSLCRQVFHSSLRHVWHFFALEANQYFYSVRRELYILHTRPSSKTFFLKIDLLPARQPLIAIHFTAIWKLTCRDLKIFRDR